MNDKILEALEIGYSTARQYANLCRAQKSVYWQMAEEDVRKIEDAIVLYKVQQAKVTK